MLGFEPEQSMVRWFSPSELVRAGIEAVISSLFGVYADNRELQAVRGQNCLPGYANREEIWVDYVADLGDGWNPTYAIAQLLAAPEVDLADPNTAEKHNTKRGDILVFGGDQVYPTARREEYRNRCVGPYRSALPCVVPESEAPDLYAVPGNHDWYDGLTSFTRQFCQKRWIGGWRTRQSRSYFALELPHGWWLWGIDIQLRSDIDEPQLSYFRAVGRRINARGVRAKIILCTAEPAWVETAEAGPKAYDTLAKFEDETITQFGHRHVVGLAGDLHAYARYESEASDDGRLRFISGGGGAYLYPTHRLPERLNVPDRPRGQEGRRVESFRLATCGDKKPAVFPPQRESRRLARGVIKFPYSNPWFSLAFGLLYGVLVWLLQSASRALDVALLRESGCAQGDCTFLGQLRAYDGSTGWCELFRERIGVLAEIIIHAPLACLLALVLLAGLVAFADGKGRTQKVLMGVLHTFIHLLVLVLLAWVFAWGTALIPGIGEHPILYVVLLSLGIVVGGAIASGFVWAFYLYGSLVLGGRHANEVFACQNLEDYKHALRLHIDASGSLTIYPMGIAQVPRKWNYCKGVKDGKPWFEPNDGKGPVHERALLIESPIHVSMARAEVAPRHERVDRGTEAR